MLKSTNKHVGIFSFIGNNILMFIFTLAFGALITSRGIDLSAVTPAKIFFSAMYIGLVFVVSSVCGYHNNRGGLIALLLVSLYPIVGTIGSTMAAQVSSEVLTPRMTSTSFITVAGLKKCIPMKRSARWVAAAMAVMEMEETEKQEILRVAAQDGTVVKYYLDKDGTLQRDDTNIEGVTVTQDSAPGKFQVDLSNIKLRRLIFKNKTFEVSLSGNV